MDRTERPTREELERDKAEARKMAASIGIAIAAVDKASGRKPGTGMIQPCPVCKGESSQMRWAVMENGHRRIYCTDPECIRAME